MMACALATTRKGLSWLLPRLMGREFHTLATLLLRLNETLTVLRVPKIGQMSERDRKLSGPWSGVSLAHGRQKRRVEIGGLYVRKGKGLTERKAGKSHHDIDKV